MDTLSTRLIYPQKDRISIFNITERNEESEITGGNMSILSNLLGSGSEHFMKNKLSRLSLLSKNTT